ncbi:osmotic avoidance abnormal protein 3-like isoform X2 [Anthonomus grandis grandis]|uniref:osmotic avoidance abnormal protein 3-like isoform X2 n=1 Tax=Anthonomus grandis grandis TaxID=2921223 RepID=UPI0021669718|nr:osmotic avoidance abnormal protein 3-like isoform X2 [Anthonomus grandis grandis]
MAENVKVIVRCRPMNKRETENNCKCVIKIHNPSVETWDPGEGTTFPKTFTFDSTYDQNSSTEAIYNDICYPLVESVLEGYNATIFVYGQTGCGKSFTMEGIPSQKGVISRAFEHLFEAISVTSGVKYLALVSYLEIYNEQIRDLLVPNDKMTNGVTLSLKETPTEGVTVPGLTQHPIHNSQEAEHYLNVGSKNRMIGATLMNQNSSRSHSIFTISIEQLNNVNNNQSIRKGTILKNKNWENSILFFAGKLNLVDLAGSERQTKTGATGDRLKEATKINLSLSALGNVISALVDGKAKHIPYRDSKLTRLLQDSLGGNTRTLMIACISPADRDYMETLSTLRYANRAKNISNKPKVNEDPKDTILRQYQEEIERLKALLSTRQEGDIKIVDLEESEVNKNVVSRNEELGVRRDKLLQEYQKEMDKLRNLHESEKNQKETVLKQIQAIKLEYEENIRRLNEEKLNKEVTSTDEVMRRIEELKKALIGGEKAYDKELSERRLRKKRAAEERANLIAHLLAKIDMNEDRETLQNQYKDISQELNLKTEILRKYRHKVKMLEKEITDLQGEFQQEREDYLETVRRQEKNLKLLSQINDKLVGTLKKDCNYTDLEAIKDQAVWLEESQKFKLPDLVIPRTKLPPAGQNHDRNLYTTMSNPSAKSYLETNNANPQDIIASYFQPATKRATELLNQSKSGTVDPHKVFNTWRGHRNFPDFARKNRTRSTENLSLDSPTSSVGKSNFWLTSGASSPFNTDQLKKPFRLEALPDIRKCSKRGPLNTMELL